jgi:hypothetical protein
MKFSVIFSTLLFLATVVSAQLSPLQKQYDWVVPHISPTASVGLTLGVTEIRVDYNRPYVKGREIWGKLVPYGEVWRAGANKATTITFGTEAMIEGQKLPAGTYALFYVPTETEWEVAFNKVAEQWGAFTYRKEADALRVKTKAQPAEHIEALEYTIPVSSPDTAQVVLHWEKLKVPFTIRVDAVGLAKKKANSTFDWLSALFATTYFLEEKSDLPEALKWANVGIALEGNYSMYEIKSRVLAQMGRFKEAIAAAEQAIEANKTSPRRIPTTAIEKRIEDWKAKL